jgi:hypothetical protein
MQNEGIMSTLSTPLCNLCGKHVEPPHWNPLRPLCIMCSNWEQMEFLKQRLIDIIAEQTGKTSEEARDVVETELVQLKEKRSEQLRACPQSPKDLGDGRER